MKKEWGLIDKILKGQKTIESRWYKARFNPWNKIKAGDVVYFKNSGDRVTAKAEVSNVLQFENIDKKLIKEIVKKYGEKICLDAVPIKIKDLENKKYCILIFLKNPEEIKHFDIDKKGFGNSCAWISVDKVDKIKKPI